LKRCWISNHTTPIKDDGRRTTSRPASPSQVQIEETTSDYGVRSFRSRGVAGDPHRRRDLRSRSRSARISVDDAVACNPRRCWKKRRSREAELRRASEQLGGPRAKTTTTSRVENQCASRCLGRNARSQSTRARKGPVIVGKRSVGFPHLFD